MLEKCPTVSLQKCLVLLLKTNYWLTFIYCDVFDRGPSLLGNRKLNTYLDTLTTRYCRVAWLPSNRGRMFPLGQPDVVRGRQYTTVS
jgi:hypothetical protein